MRSHFLLLALGASAAFAIACGDQLIADVPQDVCFTGKQWVGGKHGHPDMFPGRDCVGCHIDNDGPPLAIGGTVYPYVIYPKEAVATMQSGIDCFGQPGIHVEITDANDQVFDLITNEAGNFYVEGNPDDFAKPFSARLKDWDPGDGTPPKTSPMGTHPMYGGCAHCHDPSQPAAMSMDYTAEPEDADYVNGQPRIGLVGYKDAEVKALAMPAAMQ